MRRYWVPAAAALLTAGCGFVGEPLPPLANVPTRVEDLTVVQRGSTVIAQFTVPKATTEGMPIGKGLTLEFRAGPAAAPFNASEWAAHAKQFEATLEEKGRARYEIPAREWTGKEIVVAVKAVGRNGKDAGWSNFTIVPVVPPPGIPRDVRPESVAHGVRLVWQDGGPGFRIFRREGDGAFTLAGNAPTRDWTDTAAEPGKSYGYIVQTVVKAGEREAESEPSEEVRITPVDRFPPAAPTGLQAIASTATIELVWEQNSEPDLAGYRIYRSTSGGAFERIGESAGTPSFSDRKVERGKPYRYAVTAVDKAGNESPQSPAAEATMQ